MPGILIKDLPDDLHRRLEERAARHHRGMTREALAILEGALRGPEQLSLEDIRRLRVLGARPLSQDLVDEARDTGRGAFRGGRVGASGGLPCDRPRRRRLVDSD